MEIVDCQVHVWPPERPDRMFLRDGQGRENTPYPYEQLLGDMARAGVDRAVLVPPAIEGDRNDYALEAARKHPERFAVMGRFPIERADNRNLVEQWKEQPGMLGVRLTFHRDATRRWLSDGTADWFWPQAERHGIPCMVHAPERLKEIGEIAARHPALTLIVDHMGFARETIDDKTAPAAERIVALAQHPNVHVKVSAAPAFRPSHIHLRTCASRCAASLTRLARGVRSGAATSRACPSRAVTDRSSPISPRNWIFYRATT
jgi:L-fuconolactonase